MTQITAAAVAAAFDFFYWKLCFGISLMITNITGKCIISVCVCVCVLGVGGLFM